MRSDIFASAPIALEGVWRNTPRGGAHRTHGNSPRLHQSLWCHLKSQSSGRAFRSGSRTPGPTNRAAPGMLSPLHSRPYRRRLAESRVHEPPRPAGVAPRVLLRSEEHTSELQSPCNLVCRLLLEKKKTPVSRVRPPEAVGVG